jgi:hypothetical protein
LLPQAFAFSLSKQAADSDYLPQSRHHSMPACVFVVLSQGGRPPGSSKKAAAAAAALPGTSKPQFKAMPVSFNNAVEKVLYLEAELLSALKDIK